MATAAGGLATAAAGRRRTEAATLLDAERSAFRPAARKLVGGFAKKMARRCLSARGHGPVIPESHAGGHKLYTRAGVIACSKCGGISAGEVVVKLKSACKGGDAGFRQHPNIGSEILQCAAIPASPFLEVTPRAPTLTIYKALIYNCAQSSFSHVLSNA